MPAESRPRYANFPEREPKVVIGPNINATTAKQLSRLSIGTYEMSVSQQERGQITAEAARSAVNAVAKAGAMQFEIEKSREFVGVFSAKNADLHWKVWITTPFEPGQSAHIVWARYSELSGEKKVGVAYRLNTAHTVDDVGNVMRAAQRNAVVVPEGEAFQLKGNPPPRFQKKTAAAEPAAEAAPAAEAPQA
ncbi:MAG TPA: hypothetical protein DCS97_16605 [Planctomycetes bacterium]|nr:hypothetical protein [Planctomycetota bacterium]